MGLGQTGATGKYERKIKYLDYVENGVRMKGAGFAKLERWDDSCTISLQISGLYRRDHFTRPLLLLGKGEERELCRLQFAEGCAKHVLENLDIRDMDGQGLEYEELVGFRIPVTEGKEICCIWGENVSGHKVKDEKRLEKVREQEDSEQAENTGKEEKPKKEKTKKEKPQTEKPVEEKEKSRSEGYEEAQEENQIEEHAEEKEKGQPDEYGKEKKKSRSAGYEKVREESRIEEYEEEKEKRQPEVYMEKGAGIYRDAETQERRALGEQRELNGLKGETPSPEDTDMEETAAKDHQKMPATLMCEEKWEQLSTIYPHIFPFNDDREYLSMGPGDFVIFPRRYYKLVGNSFLLHGFYNYEHLILARMEQRGGFKYYIGVPGNYFEREKKVAVLFGFESFECEKEPAGEGDFGYYMIPVEL